MLSNRFYGLLTDTQETPDLLSSSGLQSKTQPSGIHHGIDQPASHVEKTNISKTTTEPVAARGPPLKKSTITTQQGKMSREYLLSIVYSYA